MENSKVWLGQWGYYMGSLYQIRGIENGMMLLCSGLGSPIAPDMNAFSCSTHQIHGVGDNWSNARTGATFTYAWNTHVVKLNSLMWIPLK